MSRPIAEDARLELLLLPGELPETSFVEDARHWVTVYSELAEFVERSLARLLEPESRRGALHDLAALERHRRHLDSRLEFWQRRAWELGGIDFDAAERRLRHNGREVVLTRREAQLFTFLAGHPNQFFSAERLCAEAWHAPYLSEEQLRSYIVRLRARIRELQMPCSIRSALGRGYGLSLEQPT
ncbi:MAG TPA: winged helix-turn-helix domain-containing protein [Candidatus Limnocylindrales bacterium]|nr:winged helix-turn-helix domain-containing protein [Candidatus Limnocylindrales bacterium]